jgi:hypothetical protein
LGKAEQRRHSRKYQLIGVLLKLLCGILPLAGDRRAFFKPGISGGILAAIAKSHAAGQLITAF